MDNQDTMQSPLNSLRVRIARFAGGDESGATAIPGLLLFRHDHPTDPIGGVYRPSICLVAQGAKQALLGTETYGYDPLNYLITSVHLPAIFQVVKATPEVPYLGLTLLLSHREIAQLMADSNLPAEKVQASSRGMATGTVNAELVSAFNRLLGLLEDERDIPILAPIIQREITYRLLVGEQGWRLRQIASAGSQGNQIARIVAWMTDNYKQPVRVESLAEQAGMSTSTFHHHFRSMTALSPLQYQKQLRLQEARRLMLSERLDAGDAAFEVGYESPSQFSREYSRLFGAPPLRDIRNLTQQAATSQN